MMNEMMMEYLHKVQALQVVAAEKGVNFEVDVNLDGAPSIRIFLSQPGWMDDEGKGHYHAHAMTEYGFYTEAENRAMNDGILKAVADKMDEFAQ